MVSWFTGAAGWLPHQMPAAGAVACPAVTGAELVAALHSCGRNLQLASTDLVPAAQVMGATHSKIITLIVALELQNDTKVSVAHGCCTRMPGARKEPCCL